MDRQQSNPHRRPRPRQDPATLRDLAHPARSTPTRRAQRAHPTHRDTAHARNQINAAIALLDWTADRNIALADLNQHHIDRWLTGPPPRRYARHILGWTARQHLTAKLAISAAPARAGNALDSEHRWQIARRLLHDDTLELIDRVTGSFVLLYAQPPSTASPP